MQIALTDFARRNWQPGASGTRIEGLSPDALVTRCNDAVASGATLADGYAPFCKHLFLPNDSPTRCGFAPITEQNAPLLRSGYVARREGEMAVLERWIEGEAPVARWLDVILYSHAQLVLEAADYPEDQAVPDCNWGIVSIIGTLEPSELPMPPITQWRNALGRAAGGSGQPIDPATYAQAVAFWDRHAAVRPAG
ncbi:DUF3228 family protein [Maliponia aquimaris]|uniref:Uncharacterized protein n=1 Tax=Maliponia aquimaris TaxID=1673631 RepID=A0A238KAM5_9RHOB|nr:DUF3228 family protein [Maliponia aquimaris]SMX39036.1 hypothetical protein MAA8898_01847 [Maliponia aquimaris]